MNRRFALPLLGLFLAATLAWPLWAAAAPTQESLPGKRIEIRGTGSYVRSRITRPAARSAQAAVFVVNYDAGFQANPSARAAFQYAVDIWASQLTSTVPIVVDASFEALGQNVLGSAGASYLLRNFPGAPVSNTFYSAALANKLAGNDRNTDRGDIEASFSNQANWYYGTDANPGAGEYDFVSVVMHELGHGLGFSGSGDVSNGVGTWGLTGTNGVVSPEIYDRYVQSGLGQTVLSQTSGTVLLGAILTGDSLYWGGANGVAANGGTPPRMYAPTSWDQGSSYSHLDEDTYGTGDPNSLMTPSISNGEAIHDPGPIVRGMFTDMSWTIGLQTGPTVTPTTTPTQTPTTTSPTATPSPDEPTPQPSTGPGRLLIPVSFANAPSSR